MYNPIFILFLFNFFYISISQVILFLFFIPYLSFDSVGFLSKDSLKTKENSAHRNTSFFLFSFEVIICYFHKTVLENTKQMSYI